MKENNKQNFKKLELPFLLIYGNKDNEVSYSWFETEEDLRECVKEIESYGDFVMYAMEIGNARDVELGLQGTKSVSAKKLKYRVSLSADDYFSGYVTLTESQAKIVKYATDTDNWEDTEGDIEYSGYFDINIDDPIEI